MMCWERKAAQEAKFAEFAKAKTMPNIRQS